MEHNILPPVHPDPWVDILRDYVGETVSTLSRRGLAVHRSWLDPQDPRDATIVYSRGADGADDIRALVWDEVGGWRDGAYRSGRQGVRTILDGGVHLGGKLVPSGDELAWSVVRGATAPDAVYRSFGDTRDGLDDLLRRRG